MAPGVDPAAGMISSHKRRKQANCTDVKKPAFGSLAESAQVLSRATGGGDDVFTADWLARFVWAEAGASEVAATIRKNDLRFMSEEILLLLYNDPDHVTPKVSFAIGSPAGPLR